MRSVPCCILTCRTETLGWLRGRRGRGYICSVKYRVLFGPAVLAVALAAGDLSAQPAPSSPVPSVTAAEAAVKAGRYGPAIDQYRQLLQTAGENPAGFRLALRLAELANATGRATLSYDALAPRLAKIPAGLDGEAIESGYELLAEAADLLGRRDAAIDAARRLVQARTARLGENDAATLAGALTLSVILEKGGNSGSIEEARTLRHKALDRLERGDRALYTRLLNNTAIVLQNGNRLDSAAEMFDLLLAAMAKGPATAELGITQSNAAVLARDRQRYDEAIELHRQAIAILERITGRQSEETIAALGGLGQTYGFAGQPAAAVPLLAEAYRRADRALGDSDDTMIQANNYAAVLRELGSFREAEPLDRRALAWRDKALGPAHASTLTSAKNLALDLIGLGRIAEAMELYGRVVATLERTRGRDHPQTMALRRERDMLAMLEGGASADGTAFEKLADDAAPTAESVRLANLLAGIADRKGDAETEIRLHRLSLKLAEAYYGELHPRTIAMLTNVARAAAQQKAADATAAYAALERRMSLWARREIASTSSPDVRERVAATTRESLGDILAYCLANSARDPDATALFAKVLLDWKAVGTLERTLLDSAAATLPEADRDLLAEVRRLQAASLAGPHRAATQDLVVAEARLSSRIAGLRKLDDERRRSYAEILSGLDPGDAVIDYIVLPVKRPPGIVHDRVLAMLGRSDGTVWLYDLGNAHDLDRWLDGPEEITGKDARRALYKALVAPLEARLGKVARLFVVPDGVLHLVPFDGLLDAADRNLIERTDVRIARSARTIRKEEAAEPGGVLLVGDVDYGKGPGHAMKPLPFTAKEIDAIAVTLKGGGYAPTLLRGTDANEAAVRGKAAGQRILHFATHGFFDPVTPAEAAPLWRAGIALAGANAATETHHALNDGTLYAAEAMNWPLAGVDLVVLSACSTAQGDRSYTEGLAGLPSALALAGVRRSLLARWPVEDRGAALFMAAFYEALAATRSYEKAIRIAKLASLTRGDTWLAFSLIAN